MKAKQAILAGLVYRLKRGCASPYTRNFRRYCFAVPAEDFQPETVIGDCWITDADGNPDPGSACSPVPVCRDALGHVAGRVARE